jgi:predicted TIM-barrel fold metal-dependent hydrolase
MDSDLPVIFHTGDTLATERSAKVKYAHPLAIDDVATDFPRLKIVIAHLGNPWLVDCAEVLYRNRNVYADISGLFFDEGLNTPYGKITKNKIDELIAYSDPGKLLYGTDWPLAPMKDYLAFARGLAVPRTAQRKFFSGNAMQLFRIVV